MQKRLAPYFFPDGGLSAIPKTLRIRIRTRLVALLFACNLIPLISIILILYRTLESQHEPALALAKLQSAISINVLIFIGVGICLTILVSRNLSIPFRDIIQTLRRIRNGRFDKQVQVFSNVEDSGQFMTMFFLALDTESRQIEWVRAGHDPGIVYDPGSDAFSELGGSGIALGVEAEWIYEDNKKTDF